MRALPLALLGTAALLLAAGAAPAVLPIGGRLTYRETDPGREQGGSTVGIVGHGTISITVGKRPPAGSSVAAIARGGTYVVRWTIDARGNYHGLAVERFRSAALGTACFAVTVTIGRFDPGAGKSFPPSDAVFTAIGGTGGSARLRISFRVELASVTGDLDRGAGETLVGGGSLVVARGAIRPMGPACAAVARLAR